MSINRDHQPRRVFFFFGCSWPFIEGRSPLNRRSLSTADRQPSIIGSGHRSLQSPKPQCGWPRLVVMAAVMMKEISDNGQQIDAKDMSKFRVGH